MFSDTANGAAFETAHVVYEALGAEVTVLSDSPDGITLMMTADPHILRSCSRKVVELGADVGLHTMEMRIDSSLWMNRVE